MHVFAKPNGMIYVPRDIQLCCRHELHIVVPEDEQEAGSSSSSVICSMDQILAGDAIETIIQNIVPVHLSSDFVEPLSDFQSKLPFIVSLGNGAAWNSKAQLILLAFCYCYDQ